LTILGHLPPSRHDAEKTLLLLSSELQRQRKNPEKRRIEFKKREREEMERKKSAWRVVNEWLNSGLPCPSLSTWLASGVADKPVFRHDSLF
jgi:hypothetical protein